MADDYRADGYRTGRLPLILATVVSVIWVGLVGLVLLRELPAESYDLLALLILLSLICTALVGPAAFFGIAATIFARRHAAGASADGLTGAPFAESLEDTEARLTGILSRMDTVRSLLESETESFARVGAQLQQHAENARQTLGDLAKNGAAAETAGERLSANIPALSAIADRLDAVLAAASATVERHCSQMNEAGQSLQTNAGKLEETSQRIVARLGEAQTTFGATALESRNAGERVVMSMRQEAEALGKVMTDAQARLQNLGGDVARQVAERLRGLATEAEAFEGRLKGQIEQSELLTSTTERSFQLLDARIAHNEQTSTSALERLAARVAEVNSSLDALSNPLQAGKSAVEALHASLGEVRATAEETAIGLEETLPIRAAAVGEVTRTMTRELQEMLAAINAAHLRAQELQAPIGESRAAIDDAARDYAKQRDAIAIAGEALIVELNQARLLLAEVEQQTETTSLAAATRLVDTMSQVRDVASQASATVRTSLEGVIDDARASLSDSAANAMRHSFAEPIAENLREVEAASAGAVEHARLAAERTAASMLALTSALKRLDTRIDSRMADMEAAAQRDLLTGAQLLFDRLSSHGVTLAAALGKPMTDADWAQWRKGERGMFNRRALSLLDRKEVRELKDLFNSDGEFADTARRYTAEFDAMLQRLEAATGDSALIPALYASDYGRMAAALSEIIEG